jgi:hypothetical protein
MHGKVLCIITSATLMALGTVSNDVGMSGLYSSQTHASSWDFVIYYLRSEHTAAFAFACPACVSYLACMVVQEAHLLSCCRTAQHITSRTCFDKTQM